jgi:hypothetical protein
VQSWCKGIPGENIILEFIFIFLGISEVQAVEWPVVEHRVWDNWSTHACVGAWLDLQNQQPVYAFALSSDFKNEPTRLMSCFSQCGDPNALGLCLDLSMA